MRGKLLTVMVIAIALVAILGACKKKEEAPIAAQPEMGAPAMPQVMPVKEVVVPDSVKGKWAAVKLTIEDKIANTSNDVVIPIGAEHAVAGSDLKIKVGEFLPHFKMQGSVITSASEQLENPAVHVFVYEKGEEVFKGWLYSKYPGIHPFTHERFGITLKEPVKKG